MREPTIERDHPNGYGVQRLYVFFNGYGASVVRYFLTPPGSPEYSEPIEGSPGASEGLWDLAVVEIDYPRVPTGDLPFKWTLCYSTPLATDTLGHLTEDEVDSYLSEIELLPSRSRDTMILERRNP
jgi:hypothetical protein